MATAKKTLVYKGHPLRRKDNILYYGSMSDKYIIMMQIMDTKTVQPAAGAENVGELKVASKVSVQLQLTDPDADRNTSRCSSRCGQGSEGDFVYAQRSRRSSSGVYDHRRRL